MGAAHRDWVRLCLFLTWHHVSAAAAAPRGQSHAEPPSLLHRTPAYGRGAAVNCPGAADAVTSRVVSWRIARVVVAYLVAWPACWAACPLVAAAAPEGDDLAAPRVDVAPDPVQTLPPVDSLKARSDAFSRFRDPAVGTPASMGSYSNGCLLGGVALPRSGPGFELMRLGRNRRFGHPNLIAYIERLGAAARKKKVGTLLIGDLGQARGGPTPTGHRSHQIGLDVDIGFTRPAWLERRKMNASEREQLPQVPVVDLHTRTLTAEWSPRVAQLIQLAASDPEVDRVFVHPRIKRELCDQATAAMVTVALKAGRGKPRLDGPLDYSWLRTVRPWWGHHDHLHVRLKCPPDSAGCESQAPLAPGDGCSEIAWWEAEEARRALARREPPPQPEPAPPVPALPPMPAACQALLEAAPQLRATAQRQR
jgi:penicillin-insensitive murein DD-endopeptidase